MNDDRHPSVFSVRDMLIDHDGKIDSLLEWRSELRGAMALVKFTLGASIVSGLVSVLAILAVLGGQAQ